jgi:hypothetical protein
MVQYQYDQLGVLARLDIPGLPVPRALAFLRAKRVYVMEFARGETIESLVWNRTARNDLLRTCELAEKTSPKCMSFARRRSARCRSER